MKHIASVLLLIVAALPMGANWKANEKRFDAVAVTDVRKVAGRYVGIERDYVVNLQLDQNGKLSGTLTEFGVASPLRDVRIDGAEFNATIGGLPLHGTFVKRTKDGAVSFGLLVHDSDVKIDTVTVSEMFCRKTASAKTTS